MSKDGWTVQVDITQTEVFRKMVGLVRDIYKTTTDENARNKIRASMGAELGLTTEEVFLDTGPND